MKDKIKVVSVYTGMPPSLVETVEREVRAALPDTEVVFASYGDPTIINEVVQAGGVTPGAARRLANLYLQGVNCGGDIVYNLCSSVGNVADAAKPIFEQMGMPFVRVDERMAKEAVKAGRRIGVVATLKTTLEPTKGLLRRCAAAAGQAIELVDALEDGAFGLSAAELEKRLVARAAAVADKVDCIVLAQGSMAGAEQAIAETTGKPTFSSPRFGALDVRDAALALR